MRRQVVAPQTTTINIHKESLPSPVLNSTPRVDRRILLFVTTHRLLFYKTLALAALLVMALNLSICRRRSWLTKPKTLTGMDGRISYFRPFSDREVEANGMAQTTALLEDYVDTLANLAHKGARPEHPTDVVCVLARDLSIYRAQMVILMAADSTYIARWSDDEDDTGSHEASKGVFERMVASSQLLFESFWHSDRVDGPPLLPGVTLSTNGRWLLHLLNIRFPENMEIETDPGHTNEPRRTRTEIEVVSVCDRPKPTQMHQQIWEATHPIELEHEKTQVVHPILSSDFQIYYQVAGEDTVHSMTVSGPVAACILHYQAVDQGKHTCVTTTKHDELR
jgi:hypothetical protein